MAPKGISSYRHIYSTKSLLAIFAINNTICQKNHSSARSVDRESVCDSGLYRFVKIEELSQMNDCG